LRRALAMARVPRMKNAGQCPVLGSGTIGICIEACTGDGSCAQNEKCCSNGCGRTCQKSTTSGGGVHPGQCPAVSGGPAPCLISCTGDDSCPQNAKCCSNGCGRTCQPVVPIVHPGQCPRPGGGISSCLATCSDDSSCTSDEKCCSTGCGRTCQRGCLPVPCPAPLCPIDQQQMQYANGCATCPKCIQGGCACGQPCTMASGGSGVCQADGQTCAVNVQKPNCSGKGKGIICSVDSDCQGNQSCVNSRCLPVNGKGPCQNGNCPHGQHCVNNICRAGLP